ncbi:hypothetical protein [Prosthecomicrobium hirschii]|uniref:Uncharacterized protein n=1 Tax=Prosthecodimorpha hirschii TaxID=665126 RepID=A0A0P6VWL2_9HYPH|nr:hypothetical protein [Prosthecomicrobium hirschii]KPL55551.1 hypothetical protein ABB55_27695 [Prosthecomicrobium hirschii]MCW1839461.1 hypothetical protein [Prosthecomicrobium hirschii]
MSRPFDARHHRLKAATRDLVDLCGGGERTAALAGVTAGQVSRWKGAHHGDLIPLAAVMVLEAECGEAPVSAVLAGATGRSLTGPAAGDDDAAGLFGLQARVLEQVGRLVGEFAQATADGRVTPAEAEQMDRGAAEIDRTMASFREALAGVKAGRARLVGEGR